MVSRSSVESRGLAVLALSLLAVSCARGGYVPYKETGPSIADGAADALADAAPGPDGPGDLARGDSADLLTDPPLVVSQTTGQVGVSVAGRFALTFEEQYRWQAGQWRDLAFSPSINLGGPGPSFEHKVLQGPMLLYNGGTWWTLKEMQNPTMSVKSATAQRVVLETTWTWPTGPTFAGKAVHTITADGTWAVTASIANPATTAKTVDIEYADTHVAPVNGWTATKAGDDTFYKFVRAGVPAPRPALTVTRSSDATGTILSDEAGNHYWSWSNVTLAAGGTRSWSWTNKIWPGE